MIVPVHPAADHFLKLVGWIRALEWALRQSAPTVTDTPPTRGNTGQDTAPL